MTTPLPQIPRIPWSQLGPEFALIWGRADPDNPQPEDMEIVGMKGSGKTHFMLTVLSERVYARNTAVILVVTKQQDEIFTDFAEKTGWPIVRDVRDIDLRHDRQILFWPYTKKLGAERRAYIEAQIRRLLEVMWRPNANVIIAIDEIAFVESLSDEVRDLIGMYWREARSMGISIVAMKQRPQGVQRDMHSETQWTVAFRPKDAGDLERFAELFGNRRTWMPIIESMNPDNHEFLIRHARTGRAYISWVDVPIRVRPRRDHPVI